METLDKFDLLKSTSSKSTNNIIIGKRNSGKRLLVCDIMRNLSMNGIPRACIFSDSPSNIKKFSSYFPGSVSFNTDNINARLKEIFNQQLYLIKKKDNYEIPSDIDIRIVIVFDDILFVNSPVFQKLYLYSEPYGILSILSVQDITQIPFHVKDHICNVFVFKNMNNFSLKSLYNKLFKHFESFSEFKQIFKKYTDDYGCMVKSHNFIKPNWYKVTAYQDNLIQ